LPETHELPPEVRVPPSVGEDACAIAVEGGLLVAATDPITLTGAGVGAHAVIVNANDVAVMGARPRWFLASILLPIGTTEDEVCELFAAMRNELRRVDAALVGGHTEVTGAVSQPVVVGLMLGLQPEGRCVRTGGVSVGDVVFQIGMAPVEGAAVLAVEATASLRDLDRSLLELAADALQDPGISVVEPALRAAELGATSLHDPTEGGLATALHEVAEASGVSLRVDASAVLWFEPGVALCNAVGADPWGTLASGALLASFPPERAAAAQAELAASGFTAAAIARAVEASTDPPVFLEDGTPLARFDRDELSRVL
jgi:hydrogenase maturation factor